MNTRLWTWLAIAALPSACAEATSGLSSNEADATVPAQASDAGGVPDAPNRPVGDGGSSNGALLLINEVSTDKEWVELVNASEAALDISGLGIADLQADAGTPKLSEAFHFPAGTILSPRAYVAVHNPSGDAGACPVGTESYCFKMSFGISTKNGETLFVLAANDVPISSLVVPANAAPAGATWGRIGNADPKGAFVVTVPTPGAANSTK